MAKRTSAFLSLAIVAIHATLGVASDWPAYRRDARRSATSEDHLPFPMEIAWRVCPSLPPKPAFDDPLKRPTAIDFAYIRDHSEPVQLDFDHAFHPVAAGGRMFFGSSADDSVRCVSLATGQQQWAFVTGGPVRFAPQVVGHKVYVGSDDGFVYCLQASTGAVVWQFRAAPSDRQLVGNQRMISRWPLRSGVLVVDGVVYVTAGMWPAEGVFVYALDAATGEVHWVNDTSGTLNQPTANRGAYAITGVAPTGYLLASKDALVVPTGRSIPATYARDDGRLLASTSPSYQNRKGGPAVCIDRYNSVIFGYPRERMTAKEYSVHYAYQLPNMTPFGTLRGDRVLAADHMFIAVNDVIRCVESNSRYTKVKVVWQQDCPTKTIRCLALAANALIMGIDHRVVAHDRTTGEVLWEHGGLDGYVHSIAIADQQLLVATDRGSIYCFAKRPKNTGVVPTRSELTERRNTPVTKPSRLQRALADLLRREHIHRGHVLVVGDRDTNVALGIAAQTELQVTLLLSDAQAVTRARQTLLSKQLPGRGYVSVQRLVADNPLPFADFAFNLIVATEATNVGQMPELHRVLRPAGGMLYAAPAVATKIQSQVNQTVRDSWQIASESIGDAIVWRRGKLPGALDWDSTTSADQRVKWPLELLWFGGPGSKRTGSGSRPPIAAGGRNFVIGKNHLIALDAYNGTELWSRSLPYLYRNIGRLRKTPGPIQPWLTQSINADDNHVWLNFGHVVFTLDANSGKQLAVHGNFPAVADMHFSQNRLRIAMDHYQQPGPRGVTSQSTKAARPAGEIHLTKGDEQLTLHLDLDAEAPPDDRVYWELFFDVRPPADCVNLYEPGVFQLLAWPAKRTVERGIGDAPQSISVESNGRRLTISIPLAELEKLRGGRLDNLCFAAALNHPALADQKAMAGGRAYLRWQHGADALATSFNNGWPRVHFKATAAQQRAVALPPLDALPEMALQAGRIGGVGQRAGTVVKLKGQRTTPLSLQPSDFDFNRGKGCGRLVSSDFLQVLRSGTLAFYDRNDDSGMRYFGGVRPSCTISAIPAQGVVFAAEGSSGCSCNYNFKTTLALAPAAKRRHEDWAMFTAPLSPGAQLRSGRFNLGAPGDRRDDHGGLWLQYPRPPTYSSRVLPTAARTMPVPVQLIGDQTRPYRVNADRVSIDNTDRPWLYTSGYEGLEGVRLQLFMSDKEGMVVFPGTPKLDGELESESWEPRYSAPAGSAGSALLAHDDTSLYVAFDVASAVDRRGNPLPWKTREGRPLLEFGQFHATDKADDTPVWEEDSLEFLLSDDSLQTIFHFGVGVTGGRYDGVWSGGAKQESAAATPQWSGAVKVTPEKAVAEFAIPWQALRDAGLNLNQLVIRPRTKGPLKRQPHVSHGFRPVILQREQAATKRYRVTLHFAELEDIAVGDRVFDIQIQGKTVAKKFDPLGAASGRNRAVARTFDNIQAERVLDVRFIQPVNDKADSPSRTLPLRPTLSAIEIAVVDDDPR